MSDLKVSEGYAWTATSGYRLYPPYVNLTRNKLVVRAAEVWGKDGNPYAGQRVEVELPQEAIDGLRDSLTLEVAQLKQALGRACRDIAPYVEWTVGPESPGCHPTMPSAVGAFLDATAEVRAAVDPRAALKESPHVR